MKAVPSYPKVLTIGSSMTENALVGEVIIQEKLDGSQFNFGLDENGKLVMRSKGAAIYPEEHNIPKMFELAVNFVSKLDILKLFEGQEIYFYCEFLNKPKHNVLKYNRTPTHYLMLFDALLGGRWLNRDELEEISEQLAIDIAPEIYRGEATVETIKELLTKESYLGGETVEGLVMKNYGQTISLGNRIFPLFTKYVREAFKERHHTEWKIKKPKGALEEYIDGFRTEARWQKAFQYLRDKGEIENQPRDIGKLVVRVQQDIIEEEEENIKKELYNKFIKDITSRAVRGLPEWYKTKLLESIEK